MLIRDRYNRLMQLCLEHMPEPKTELHYHNPYELMVAVILSAQCTDKRVNIVTPPLFQRYPDVQSMAESSEDELFSYIKSISYPNAKTRHLIAACKKILEVHNGILPADFDSLIELPGVGRKTANVLLSVLWQKEAMAVDTHVFRVSNRIGLTKESKTPLQTEKTLTRYFPGEILHKAHHWLILHGRYVCKARRPLCDECFLTEVCADFEKRAKKETTAKNKK